MGGGGRVTRTRWWWCGDALLGHKRGVVGLGHNTRNRAVAARFRARRVKRRWEEVPMIMEPPRCGDLECGGQRVR